MSAVDVLAVMDEFALYVRNVNSRHALQGDITEARAAVAELIAERDRLANIVNSHEAQIVRMTAERDRLVHSVGHTAYALEQDGRTVDGITKEAAAECLRAAIARATGAQS